MLTFSRSILAEDSSAYSIKILAEDPFPTYFRKILATISFETTLEVVVKVMLKNVPRS